MVEMHTLFDYQVETENNNDFFYEKCALGCEGATCSLDTFIGLYGARLPDDMDEECESDRFKRKKQVKSVKIILRIDF